MLDAQRRLSTGFLMLLSLPTAAVGFSLSAAIASTTWLLSTRYGLHLENIALIWLAGPLMGLVVQPLVGALSDRTWLLGGRRRLYLLLGGAAGAVSMYAMLHLERLAAATTLSLLAVAVIVTLLLDLSTNVTFNPARSLVADLTPEGPPRVRGYAWMQTVSGLFGVSAYLVSILLGNEVLILVTVAVTGLFTVLPALLIREQAPQALAAAGAPVARRGAWRPFQALLPMAGFGAYGVYIAVDKVLLGGAASAAAVPLFGLTLGSSVAWGLSLVWRDRARPSAALRLRKILLAHGLAWLGVQGMFVMAFFFVRDFIVPGTVAGGVMADVFHRWLQGSEPSAADTAAHILSTGFLLMNIVGALLPVLVLDPLCRRWGQVAVHRTAMGVMALGFLFIALAARTEGGYYVGMLLCGIGWSSLISIVFAIFSESVDAREMGVSMGVFNSSLVLPALAVPGLLQWSAQLGQHRWVFALFAGCLALSWAFWRSVSEAPPPAPPSARSLAS